MPSTAPKNVLFILSDEHNARVAGCYGHPFVQTPTLDGLAARGTRFASAYCNSPICVPSRASLATGRQVHEIGFWDNAFPYTGTPRSWHHALRESGRSVASIGKLHFRGGDDYGFTEELLPLHVVDGKGDLKGLFRKELPPKTGTRDLAEQAGRGSSTYSHYDAQIAMTAQNWLRRRALEADDTPFVLFVSFVMPHFPMVAPEACYDLYVDLDLATLRRGLTAPPPEHPTLDRMRRHFDYDAYFDDDRRAAALRAYFGMVTRVDELVGEVLGTLSNLGLSDTTQVIYSSDHGDNLGNRGMWGKSVMYDDSVRVPLIMAGQEIPQGHVVDTPVSLIDIAPTVAAMTGADASAEGYPGRSLLDIAAGAELDRAVLSEYHAAGSDTGQFMIRRGKWKYVAYVDAPPQLFDLEADPDELRDLGRDEACSGVMAELDRELRRFCDPDEVNARAFADQQALIRAHGGREAIEKSADIPFTPAPV